MIWGWSFRDKSIWTAIGISLLWHGFWFFSVVITVNPQSYKVRSHPQVVSLGPVLDDAIFRTLVEAKPEFSKTFYRRPSDFRSPVDLDVKTMDRQSQPVSGGALLPVKNMQYLKSALGGEKASPIGELRGGAFSGIEPDPDDPEYLRYWKSRVGA